MSNNAYNIPDKWNVFSSHCTKILIDYPSKFFLHCLEFCECKGRKKNFFEEVKKGNSSERESSALKKFMLIN